MDGKRVEFEDTDGMVRTVKCNSGIAWILQVRLMPVVEQHYPSERDVVGGPEGAIEAGISTNKNRSPPTRACAPSMEIAHQDSPPPELPGAPLSHPVMLQRKVTPTERKSPKLPSPPSSSDRRRARTAADELPEIFVVAKRDYETRADLSKRLRSVPLSNQDYVRFLSDVETTFRRFDYDARCGRLPISNAIVLGLSELGRGNADLFLLTANIHKDMSSNISPYDTDDPSEDGVIRQRSRDGQFIFSSGFATVVIEVAYSQDKKLLCKAAK
ncbi:hypothetical protein FMEXI_12896 [Fusarium mexicanum]|uniref:Uncharacterized protein n=1 Tax=Fusarium mexicanum TaxID=751941 RepID=A0A8H5MKV8_9HYPO|nr:hypothetical protein FMEXI_12896 [Fusarium mexicanum]